jgi:glycerol-3-phosphate dehydrogenase
MVLADVLNEHDAPRLRLVRGSHIVVRALFDHPYAYIFQNADRRVVFAIPYENDFTLIGTTEVEVRDPADECAADDEVAYLLAAASRYFAQPVTAGQIVHRYAGVRPLLAATGSAHEVSRDYRLAFDRQGAPLLTVFGGKITTFRRLAEQAVDALAPALGCTASAWTRFAFLPGGDLPAAAGTPQDVFAAYVGRLQKRYPHYPPATVHRLAPLYGSAAPGLLATTARMIAADVSAAELEHSWTREWARTGEDYLWRRTKLGLHLAPAEQARIAAWFEARRNAAAAAVQSS